MCTERYIYGIFTNWFLYFVVSAAIATVVTVAEILKNNGLAVEKSKIVYLSLNVHVSTE